MAETSLMIGGLALAALALSGGLGAAADSDTSGGGAVKPAELMFQQSGVRAEGGGISGSAGGGEGGATYVYNIGGPNFPAISIPEPGDTKKETSTSSPSPTPPSPPGGGGFSSFAPTDAKKAASTALVNRPDIRGPLSEIKPSWAGNLPANATPVKTDVRTFVGPDIPTGTATTKKEATVTYAATQPGLNPIARALAGWGVRF